MPERAHSVKYRQLGLNRGAFLSGRGIQMALVLFLSNSSTPSPCCSPWLRRCAQLCSHHAEGGVAVRAAYGVDLSSAVVRYPTALHFSSEV